MAEAVWILGTLGMSIVGGGVAGGIIELVDSLTGRDVPGGAIRQERGSHHGTKLAIAYLPHDGLNHTNLEVLRHMVVAPTREQDSNAAVFHNPAMNLTAQGTITGYLINREHGIHHGHLYVPQSDNIQPFEAKWMYVDPNTASKESAETFKSLVDAVENLSDDNPELQNISRVIEADDVQEAAEQEAAKTKTTS